MLNISDLLTLEDTIAAPLFAGKTYPWEVLDGIGAFILALGNTLPLDEFDHPSEDVWIAKDAKVFPSAYIGGPCIIDHEAESATVLSFAPMRLSEKKPWSETPLS